MVLTHSASEEECWWTPILLRLPSTECRDQERFLSTSQDRQHTEALSGMQLFIDTLDLRSGYWQVPVEDTAKEKTAFSAGRGLWQFQVIPFGLCNTPATFERLMEQVLSGLPLSVALVYIDDILVPGKTFDDHLSDLCMVFQHIRDAKLKLAPPKCMLLQP